MTKFRIALAALMAFPAACAQSQTLVSPALQAPKPAQTQASTIKTIRVRAAPEPDPALRYRFWPAPADRTNGSPVPFVNRAVILQIQGVNSETRRTEFSEKYAQWGELPCDELPKDEVRAFLDKFGRAALGELERAGNLMRVDYDLQLDNLSTAELVQTLLPEYQEMRQLARLLHLRIRLGIAEQRWDDVADDIRLGFRLAEVAGHSTDFLIGRLIGFAISGLMMNATLEAIEQPGCPNFYWALASLPAHRLFETRDSIEFESVLMSRLIRSPPLPDHPIGADEARALIKDLADQASVALSYGSDDGNGEIKSKFLSGLYVIAMADESREFLAETTNWGERARDLSAPEAVLRASYLKFARARDEWVKWSLLPASRWDQYRSEREAVEKQNSQERDFLTAMIGMLQPAVDAARRAGRRTRQQRNMLISIEALRMYAAEHGELPPSIEDLRPVPCWPDGIALKPFGYQRTGPETATLTRAKRWSSDPETTFHIELIKGNDK